jgi:hypothetical protein
MFAYALMHASVQKVFQQSQEKSRGRCKPLAGGPLYGKTVRLAGANVVKPNSAKPAASKSALLCLHVTFLTNGLMWGLLTHCISVEEQVAADQVFRQRIFSSTPTA